MVRYLLLLSLAGCAASTHDTRPGALGRPASSDDALAAARSPGPVKLTRVRAADWAVTREGLVNLEHPRAIAAGLDDSDEPIEIAFYVLEHPEHGTWFVDSGVARAFRSEDTAPVSALLASAMNLDALKVQVDTADWLVSHGPPRGVWLTHMHLDHVMGLPDLPREVALTTGPGEADGSMFVNAFVQGTTDDLLEGFAPISEWPFQGDAAGRFAGVLDVFGDRSVFALHVPGHTPGSTAYLVCTPEGPVLLTGDASHTRWGWENDVDPGTFSNDREQAAIAFGQLRAFAAELPGLRVYAGHKP